MVQENKLNLCVIEGDGVGHEVIPAAVRILRHVLGDRLNTIDADAGWDCFLQHGSALPAETIAAIRTCGAALFGAVSSPSRKVEGYRSPIIQMRQTFDLYANLRPVRGLTVLPATSTKLDMLIVRENTQGLYVQREYMRGDEAVAERVITRAASARIGRLALEMAAARDKRLCIVHKANILPLTDGVFRDAIREQQAAFADIKISELLVDSAALAIGSKPGQFDVIVTTNLFGDILSDLAAMHCGGMGVAPSLNLGTGMAIAEPVHGSAPDIAGKGVANPAGAMLSAAMLCRHHWQLPETAEQIELAVRSALQHTHTPDMGGSAGTEAVTSAVLAYL